MINTAELPSMVKEFSPQQSLAMWKRMCDIRYFELCCYESIKAGKVNCPVYLSVGQESIASAVATVFKPDYIFAQHRGHSVYLAFGGNPVKLIDELIGLSSGCSGGRGGSPSIQCDEIGMIGHHGLIGENVPLVVGAALGKPDAKVVCFAGDGAMEEDYVSVALGFAITHKLRILFICEDNDLSILTPKKDRRSWNITDVAKAMGMPAVDIVDDPWRIAHFTARMSLSLPAFINCRTCRHLWHVGAGVDGKPAWDRFALTREQLEFIGAGTEADNIEKTEKAYMEGLWTARLQIPLEK